MVLGFAKSIKELGHRYVFSLGQEFAESKYLNSHKKGGNDNDPLSGVDSVNFVYLSSHSGVAFKGKPDRYWFVLALNDKTNNCYWTNLSAEFGDTNLKWVVFDSCQSMQLSIQIRE